VLPRLSLQLKRDLHLTEKNSTFDEVLRACWDTFCGTSFRFGLDRLGMALQVYNKRVDEHFLPLLEMARNSNQAAFDLMIAPQGVANATQRDFVKMIEAKLIAYNGGALEEDALRRFLASLVILHFDFGSEGSRDYAYIVEVLRRLLPPKEHHRAPELFLALERYATAAKVARAPLTSRIYPNACWLMDFCCRAPLRTATPIWSAWTPRLTWPSRRSAPRSRGWRCRATICKRGRAKYLRARPSCC
jgi:hypothetical protein